MSVTLDADDEPILGLRPDGRPDAGYAAALGLVPASAARRSCAFAIDAVIVAVLSAPLSLGALPLWLGIVTSYRNLDLAALIADRDFLPGLIFYAVGQGLLSIFVLVQLILHGLRGVTVGKAIVGIRSVDVARFGKPGFWRILVRALVFWLSLTIVPLLGAIPFLLSPLWDGELRGRGWLDRVGRNWLIDARRGLDPFDRRALRHARKRVAAPVVADEGRMPSLATGSAGAVPSFLPASRSSSGVVSAPTVEGAPPPWSPPTILDPPTTVDSRTIGTPPLVPAFPARSGGPVGRSALPAVTTRGGRSAVMTFDDGRRITVTGIGLLGRNPLPTEGERVTHLVPIEDDSRQISKTHATFGVDERGFWLMDRASVNGTAVTERGGARRELTAWQRENVPWHAEVEAGGRRFTVTPGSGGNSA